MKKIVLLLLASLPVASSAQVSFSFEDGSSEGWSFSEAGHWAVDDYEALNGMFSMRHLFNNTSAATEVASFSIKELCPSCASVTWSITLRHGYAPSASNKWAFVLCSGSAPGNLRAATGYNGFVVGVNISGYDDTLRLYRVIGSSLTKVISTDINWEKDIGTSGVARITVVRSAGGEWRLKAEDKTGNSPGEWTGTDAYEPVPVSAGVVYSYTASADQLLWFDDVSVAGVFISDNDPPEITGVRAVSDKTLLVSFDEELKNNTLDPSTVTLLAGQKAVACVNEASGVYRVTLSGPVVNKTDNILKIINLCDESDNCITETLFHFTPALVEAGDVVIEEIMFDPYPSVGLPEEEYVEIINLTEFSFSTDGWMLIAGADTSFFPETNIGGGEIMILCNVSDTMAFRKYGMTTGIKPFPGLNDTGEKIALRDAGGKLVHALHFGPELYNDNARSGGGWSAEMTDTSHPFNTPYVWRASQNPRGGTPGEKNSIENSVADNTCPQLLTVFPYDTKSIVLWFNESVKGAFHHEGFFADEMTATSVKSLDIADMTFLIEFGNSFEAGKVCGLTFPSSLSDFAGNALCQTTAFFGLPVNADVGEILFNEILFNPVSPGADFIELYNNSSSSFDLSECYFTSTNPATGEESATVPVCSFPRLILPGELTALTTDRESLIAQYPCAIGEMVVETAVLPSMADDEGIVTLYRSDLKMIDRVAYSKTMHLMYINNDEGISLEKVSPVLPSGVSSNWHSAAESCSWGTPGASNSVSLPGAENSDGVILSAERVSPDGDGYEDVVSVDVFPGGEENVVSVKIFNDRGEEIRRLAERFYAGNGARFIWDGTGEDGRLSEKGLYLITVTVFNSKGEVHHWKKVCAVLYR